MDGKNIRTPNWRPYTVVYLVNLSVCSQFKQFFCKIVAECDNFFWIVCIDVYDAFNV